MAGLAGLVLRGELVGHVILGAVALFLVDVARVFRPLNAQGRRAELRIHRGRINELAIREQSLKVLDLLGIGREVAGLVLGGRPVSLVVLRGSEPGRAGLIAELVLEAWPLFGGSPSFHLHLFQIKIL